MTIRRQAFLEAALICSEYADTQTGDVKATALHCSALIWREADSAVHFYPPGKPVIDDGQEPRE